MNMKKKFSKIEEYTFAIYIAVSSLFPDAKSCISGILRPWSREFSISVFTCFVQFMRAKIYFRRGQNELGRKCTLFQQLEWYIFFLELFRKGKISPIMSVLKQTWHGNSQSHQERYKYFSRTQHFLVPVIIAYI